MERSIQVMHWRIVERKALALSQHLQRLLTILGKSPDADLVRDHLGMANQIAAEAGTVAERLERPSGALAVAQATVEEMDGAWPRVHLSLPEEAISG